MIGRSPLFSCVTVLFALTLLGGTALQAQQTVSSRFRVFIPDFQPLNDEDDDFGKDLADELRDLIDDMLTHSAVDEDDIKDALKEYDLDMEDLTCITSRQLALQKNYQVVLCARYAGTKERWEIQRIQFVDSGTGEVFAVDNILSAEKMEEEAAQQIVQSFELFVEQTRVAIFCRDYAQSQQWENSLQNCDRALELNPTSITSRYTRANVLRQTDRYEESLEETQRVLEYDPYHTNALLLGGFLASNISGQEDLARDFYNRYLEQDPTNASVRMNVAYDLAQQGDALGGMLIIEQGVELDPDNIAFYEQLGNFAFAGAERVRREAALDGSDGLTAQVRELYGKAIAAYERVFVDKGEEMLVSQLRNVAAAQLTLGNMTEAASFSERAIASHPEEASLRDIYARALYDSGQISEAVTALSAIEEIDPDWPNLHLRMASWMTEEGRIEDAVPVLESAVARGATPDQAANMIFSFAYSNYVQPQEKNYSRFIELVLLAKEFEVGLEAREQYDFWHGYSIFTLAIEAQTAEDVAGANRSLPMFRQALGLFQEGKGYADRTASIEYQVYVDNTNTYIEIQDAIIRRANR